VYFRTEKLTTGETVEMQSIRRNLEEVGRYEKQFRNREKGWE
jgi:hypothetical protein